MRYDVELVRKLLLAAEASPEPFTPRGITVEGYDNLTIGYHAHLMLGEGLITGAPADFKGHPSSIAVMTGLTSKGHHLLDAARDARKWKRKFGALGRKVGDLALATMIKQAAAQLNPLGWAS